MAEHTLDITRFRATFPAFANPDQYPDAYIQLQWDMATAFIRPVDSCFASGKSLDAALYLMTAHLITLNPPVTAEGGGSGGGAGEGLGDCTPNVTGVISGATIDKVSVQLAVPQTRSGWQYWLASSPYGMQLWALLKSMSAGGFYIGGRPERAGFRKVYGGFR